MIYQICDVMMTTRTWDGTFLSKSFELQLINPPDLVNW